MANINIDVDTSKKTMSVKVDGKKISDVREVFAFTEDSFMGFNIEVVSVTTDNDLRTVTRLVANEAGDLVEDPNSVEKDIYDLFRHRK